MGRLGAGIGNVFGNLFGGGQPQNNQQQPQFGAWGLGSRAPNWSAQNQNQGQGIYQGLVGSQLQAFGNFPQQMQGAMSQIQDINNRNQAASIQNSRANQQAAQNLYSQNTQRQGNQLTAGTEMAAIRAQLQSLLAQNATQGDKNKLLANTQLSRMALQQQMMQGLFPNGLGGGGGGSMPTGPPQAGYTPQSRLQAGGGASGGSPPGLANTIFPNGLSGRNNMTFDEATGPPVPRMNLDSSVQMPEGPSFGENDDPMAALFQRGIAATQPGRGYRQGISGFNGPGGLNVTVPTPAWKGGQPGEFNVGITGEATDVWNQQNDTDAQGRFAQLAQMAAPQGNVGGFEGDFMQAMTQALMSKLRRSGQRAGGQFGLDVAQQRSGMENQWRNLAAKIFGSNLDLDAGEARLKTRALDTVSRMMLT